MSLKIDTPFVESELGLDFFMMLSDQGREFWSSKEDLRQKRYPQFWQPAAASLFEALVAFIEKPENWQTAEALYGPDWTISTDSEDRQGRCDTIRCDYPANVKHATTFENALKAAALYMPFDDKKDLLVEVMLREDRDHILLVREKVPHAKRVLTRLGEQSYVVRDNRALEYAVRRHRLDKEPHISLSHIYPLPQIKESSLLTVFVADRDNHEEPARFEYVLLPANDLKIELDYLEIWPN